MDDGVFLHLATMDVPTKLDAGILGKGKKGECSRTAGIVRNACLRTQDRRAETRESWLELSELAALLLGGPTLRGKAWGGGGGGADFRGTSL